LFLKDGIISVVVLTFGAFGIHIIRFGSERRTRDQALKHDRDEGENFGEGIENFGGNF
jgi:hypothetical protein